MIRILTQKGDAATDFLQDLKNDFWTDIKKNDLANKVVFIEENTTFSKVGKFFLLALEKVNLSFNLPIFLSRNRKNTTFALILGPDFGKFILHRLRGNEISVYVMDAWPNYHRRIEIAIKVLGIKKIFFPSKQVADIFRAKGILEQSIWLPEAVRFEKYFSKSIEEKNIDVLNFGRKWDLHHNKIVHKLEENNISYIYEKIKGVLVIPDNIAFLDFLSRAKITICVPSSISHPCRSGEINTMTQRYLQCMASKSIVLGVAPPELIELFGYNPVVEIDIDNPFAQIESILQNLHLYGSLIEKNYEEVKKNHTWENRWLQIQKNLENKV